MRFSIRFIHFLLLGSFVSTAYSQSDLPWWPVNETQLKSAPCKSLESRTIEQLTSEIMLDSSQKRTNDYIYGVRIENESPNLIEAFKTLTTRTAKHGGTWGGIQEEQIDLQAEFSINPTCTKVLCAVEKIWGKELGPRILWIYLKHGYNTSEFAFDSTDRFTLAELNDVMMALEDLPPHVVPLGYSRNQRLVPIGKNDSSNSGQVVADSTIILFNIWRNHMSSKRQQSLFHELGHNLSARLLDQQSLQEWKNFSKWVPTRSGWSSADDACFVSGYSKETPGEDFAESVVAYRYDAKNFKSKCPEKYEFIRTKVMKIEYLDSSMCKNNVSAF